MNTTAKVGLAIIGFATLIGIIGLFTFFGSLSSVQLISDGPQQPSWDGIGQGINEMVFAFSTGFVGTIVLIVGLATNKPTIRK